METASRLRQIRDKLGLSVAAFAKNIGVKDYKIRDSEAGKQKISSDLLEKIGISYNVDLNWLLTGQGSMFKDTNQNNHVDDIPIPYFKKVNDNEDDIDVQIITGGAGTGVYNFDTQETLLSLNPKLFPSLVGHHITAVQIDGDSMEPTLRQGDYILITPPTADRQTEDGIYAIRIDGMIKVKSLQFLMDGTIKIISDNPKYSPEIYDPKTSQIDFEILGKQRLTISR